MFDTKGPFELITQDSICNYNKTNPNYFTIKRKMRKESMVTPGKDNNKLSVEEWNTQFTNNTKASNSVIDPDNITTQMRLMDIQHICTSSFISILYDMYI